MVRKILNVGLLKLVATAIAFAFNVILTRSLGSEQSGLFFISFSIVFVVAAFVRLGLDNVLLREISSNWRAHPGLVRGSWEKALVCVSCVSGLAVVLGYIFAPWASASIFGKPELVPVVRWMILGLPFFSMMFLSGFAFQAIDRPSLLVFFQNFGFQIFLIFFFFIHYDGTAEDTGRAWFVVVSILGMSGVFLFSFFIREAKAMPVAFSKIVRPAMPLWWAQMLVTLQQFGMPIILGVIVTASEVAWFYSAQKVAMLVSLVLVIVNIVVAPRFATLYKKNDITALRRLSKKSVLLTLTVGSPVIALIFFFAGWTLSFFGDGFESGANALRILALGQLFNVATGSVGYLLMMTRHEKRVSQTATLNAILLIIIGIILVPIWGLNGAALAIAIPMILGNLLNVYWVHKELGFNTLVVWRD